MKVNFLICGTQKGGTSALDKYLRCHPHICMADTKEVHFFDDDQYFDHPNVNYTHYHSFFHPRPEHQMIGEATPIYMYWQQVPSRIKAYNPKMKLIVLIRNPITRAYSHWNMEIRRNAESQSFMSAIGHELSIRKNNPQIQDRIRSYIDRGFYMQQLGRLWQLFPHNQVLILKSEDLLQNPANILNQVYDFLNVKRTPFDKELVVHKLPYEEEMTKKEFAHLRSIFESEISEIERTLAWDCSNWLTLTTT